MDRQRSILEAIDAVYDAATAPEQWPRALGTLRDLLDSGMASMSFIRGNDVLIDINVGADPAFADRLGDTTHDNPWLNRSHLAPLNRAIVGEQLASPGEVRRSAHYNELLRHMDLLHLCGVAFHRKDGVLGSLAVTRSERKGPFEPDEVARLDALAPHFSRAASITSVLRGLDLYSAGLAAAADRLAFGLLLLDGCGRVRYANAEAERLLAAGRLRRGRDSRLVGPSSAPRRGLDALLGRVTILREAASVRLDPGDGPGLRLVGMPLPLRRRDFAGLVPSAECVVFAFDEAAGPVPPIRLIAELYGLTAAEARLTQALLSGETLGDYGDRTGHTRNTLKAQLASIFHKTGTSRQTELIRQLAPICATVSDEEPVPPRRLDPA